MKKKVLASLGLVSMVFFLVFGTTILFNSGSLAQASEQVVEEHKEATNNGVIDLKPLGASLAIGLAAIGTGLAQSKIGPAGIGAVLEKPDTMPTAIVFLAIPETLVILGFVIAAMIMLF